MFHEAVLWRPDEKGSVACALCGHRCLIPEGRDGVCRVRFNRDGTLFVPFGYVATSLQLDPVEKKPFFHVLPGTLSFSLATAGCNFDCKFCQNWEISQTVPEDTYNYDLPPERIVELAVAGGEAFVPQDLDPSRPRSPRGRSVRAPAS